MVVFKRLNQALACARLQCAALGFRHLDYSQVAAFFLTKTMRFVADVHMVGNVCDQKNENIMIYAYHFLNI